MSALAVHVTRTYRFQRFQVSILLIFKHSLTISKCKIFRKRCRIRIIVLLSKLLSIVEIKNYEQKVYRMPLTKYQIFLVTQQANMAMILYVGTIEIFVAYFSPIDIRIIIVRNVRDIVLYNYLLHYFCSLITTLMKNKNRSI